MDEPIGLQGIVLDDAAGDAAVDLGGLRGPALLVLIRHRH